MYLKISYLVVKFFHRNLSLRKLQKTEGYLPNTISQLLQTENISSNDIYSQIWF